jgi:anaerobic ribonucleoside-triphosphate reductase activating protein
MDERLLRVAHVEPATTAEGPGVRWALWVQGCSIGCADCCNPHMWGPSGGVAMSVGDLIHAMLAAPVEGITLLGGEPFEQAAAAAELAATAQENGRSVMTFTGYRYETLRSSNDAGRQALLSATDLLVDGPFLRDRIDAIRPWVGSTNQRFVHLSSRYRNLRLDVEHDRVEIRVRRDGAVAVNGWPESPLIESLEQLVDDL